MAQNDKGKALYNGLRKEDFSNEDRLGVKKEKEEAADIMLPKFDELETRIENLEAVFKYLKEMKEKGDKENCGSS
jgi:uncharacterized protein YdiU (UPF0061 family)